MRLRSFFRAPSLRAVSSSVLLRLILLAGVSAASVAESQPVYAADEIRLLVGGPLVFSVSVDSLEAFAQYGDINKDLRLLTRFVDGEAITGLSQALQASIPLTVQQVDNLGYSVLGQDILSNVGQVIRPHPSLNGDRALRGAIITAAAQAELQSEDWTAIDVMRKYPSQTIDVRLQELLTLRRFIRAALSENEQAVTAIQSQDAIETNQRNDSQLSLSQDLSVPGPYTFEKGMLTLTRDAERQTSSGIESRYSFTTDTYIPEGLGQPAPVVIVSHGYSDTKENFGFIGRHLASHGFVVLIPEHVGSDLRFRLNYTEGRLQTGMNPTEYVSRPQEVSYLIDQLEMLLASSPTWAAQVDLDRIGVVGHSLGAATAYSLAGADINLDRLTAICEGASINLSPALYLQCLGRFLSAQDSSLKDSRITAIISANGIGSALFGPEELEEVTLPILMASAANDVVAPAVTEQIQPFSWVGADEKYLAVMSDASHFSLMSGEDTSVVSPLTQPGAEAVADIVLGQYRDIGSGYFEALNLAFWNVYLRGDSSYLPYLSDRYAQQLSVDQIPSLNIVRESQLE
ncbi:MAG: alpha/beta hydrolase [Cyanobacteria bacterium P01_D01_bin.105]